MSVPVAGKWLKVSISGTNTSVAVGKTTHKLPYTPEVWAIVPARTSDTGGVNPNTAFWWDRTAADTGDGGNAVTIACGTAPGASNAYFLYVLLGPSGPTA